LEGDLEASQRHWAAAAKAYRSALDKNPSTDLAIKLHRISLTAGQFDEALQFERIWVRRYPKDAIFIYHLGDVALGQKNFELARQRYEAVLSFAPENAAALNNLAWLLNRSKDATALNYALKATQLKPKEPAFMDTLAEIYAEKGQLPKAVEIQKAAVAASVDNDFYRLKLARYYLKVGQKDLAKLELDRLAVLGDSFRGQAEVRAMLSSL